MNVKVYECECGQWSRAQYKILDKGKAICRCGKEMALTTRRLKKLKSATEEDVLEEIIDSLPFESDYVLEYDKIDNIINNYKQKGIV